MLFFKIFLACVFFSSVTSLQNELEFFSGVNFTGTSLILREKFPDLGDFEPFVNSAQSFCTVGCWVGFNATNFSDVDIFADSHAEKICHNYSKTNLKSIRYSGPADLSTQSISFYNGSSSNPRAGTEVTVTNPAGNNFGFVPTFAFSTGYSNWTAFGSEDFSGNTTCFFASTYIYNAIDLTKQGIIIKSVLKGCDSRKIDKYVRGDEVVDFIEI